MRTMHPSIMLGSYVLDEDRIPRDEFDIRLAPLRDAMARENWAATLIYGDARDHEALAFLTNFIPRMRWAMAMIPAKGDAKILISMSSRDMPAMRTMTWIADPKSGWEWKWFDEFVKTLPAEGKIATMGFDFITSLLFGQVEKSLGGRFELVDADPIVATSRQRHRPREVAVIRVAADIAAAAGRRIAERFNAGDDVETAALAGERVARDMAVQDVRTLVSRDGGRTLQPYRARFTDKPKTLLGYVAVKFQGYWAETFINVGAADAMRRANAGLDAMLAEFRPGASGAAITRAARGAAGPALPALGEGVGHRIGLSPVEGPELRVDGDAAIMDSTVYALRVGALDDSGGAVASAMVLHRGDGALQILHRNDSP